MRYKQKRIKELCKEDNLIKKLFLEGNITCKEYDLRISAIHREYGELINERKLLKELYRSYKE